MKIRKAMRLSLLFIFIGFIGGAIRYWRWWPSHTTPHFMVSGILCPLCPNIDGVGTDWDKFVSRTTLGGLLNIVPALVLANHRNHRYSQPQPRQLLIIPIITY